MADNVKEISIRLNLEEGDFTRKLADINQKISSLEGAGFGDSTAASNLRQTRDTLENIYENYKKIHDISSESFGPRDYKILGKVASHVTDSGMGGEMSRAIASQFGEISDEADKATSSVQKLRATIESIPQRGALGKLYSQMEKVKKSTDKAYKRMNMFKKILSKIQSFSLYRLVRATIMTLVQGLKEGVQNLARYDKAMGNIYGYNNALSEMSTIWLQIKNTLGVTGASIIKALMPAIAAIANGFIMAANAANAFLAAVTGSGTFLKAKKVFVDYAGSLDKSASSAKQLKNTLFGFDELNILPSQNGGDSGIDPSSMFEPAQISENLAKAGKAISDGFAAIKQKIKANLQEIEIIAGGFLIALGTILLMTGHPAIGIGLLASGLATFSIGISQKFGFIDDISEGLGTIVKIASGASLALGLIIAAFTPFKALGLGLIIAGVAGFATAATINEGKITGDVAGVLSKITAIASGAMLALGVLLIGVNPALALGLILGGAAGLASVVAINWDAIVDAVSKTWEKVKQKGRDIIQNFKDFGSEIRKGGEELIQNLVDGIVNKFNSLKSTVTGALGKLANWLFTGTWDNGEITIGTTQRKSAWSGISYAGPRAGGGTVPTGQLFIANEAGPELVGTVGGKTTVTNQDQFIAGLMSANETVVQATLAIGNAIVEAINNKNSNIELDGEIVTQKLYPLMQSERTRVGNRLGSIQGV